MEALAPLDAPSRHFQHGEERGEVDRIQVAVSDQQPDGGARQRKGVAARGPRGFDRAEHRRRQQQAVERVHLGGEALRPEGPAQREEPPLPSLPFRRFPGGAREETREPPSTPHRKPAAAARRPVSRRRRGGEQGPVGAPQTAENKFER